MRLTPEQQKLVEQNHKLIYFVLHKNNWSVDKFYDVAAIGLCKAALTYEAKSGFEFSTYATRVISNQVLETMRYESAKKRNRRKDISLDTIKEDYLQITCEDTERSILLREALNKINELPVIQRWVAKLTVGGYTQTEIAEKLGISITKVGKTLEEVRNILSNFI